MEFKIKSQLPYEETGGILDDCGPSSAAAAVAWASKYVLDPSAGDGIKAKEKATGHKDKQGVSDNGSTLSELAKTAELLGAKARYPKDWADVIDSGKKGAAIIINVQAAKGYPPQAISKWHKNWESYWKKKDPKVAKAGYGHMICAAYDVISASWILADPTFSGKGKEAYGVKVSEQDVLAVALSKGDAPHARCLIVKYKEK